MPVTGVALILTLLAVTWTGAALIRHASAGGTRPMSVRDYCCILKIDGLPVLLMVSDEMTRPAKEEPD
jgi:hypothetical protein